MIFKVGDRVRITDYFNPNINSLVLGQDYSNKIYTIADKDTMLIVGYTYGLKGTANVIRFYEEELELALVRNNKLSRKLYPNAKEDGKWLRL